MSINLSWSAAYALPFAPFGSSEPALLHVGDALHLVFVSNKTLYHTRMPVGGEVSSWQPPVRFASGEAPALTATADGKLHCAFTNWFLGNCEVYCATWDGQRWSLPWVVSRTSGVSTAPALAAGPDGSLHAVWSDTTPGRSVIYYGRKGDVAWTSGPIPNGAGSCPTIAITPDGEIRVAWQDRLTETGCFEVFSTGRKGGTWSIPQIVSDSPARHSLNPRLAVNAKGICHLIWQEEAGRTYTIRSAERLPSGWMPPGDISELGTDCRLARIATRATGIFQAVWAGGATVHHRPRPAESRAYWWQPEVAHEGSRGIGDLAAAVGPTGETHVVWSAYTDGDQRLLYHARREPVPMQGIFIPFEVA